MLRKFKLHALRLGSSEAITVGALRPIAQTKAQTVQSRSPKAASFVAIMSPPEVSLKLSREDAESLWPWRKLDQSGKTVNCTGVASVQS
jgi:hypothetical protein